MPRELTDVDVQFVSYVDSAANQRKFFLTKSDAQPTWEKQVKLLTKANDEQMLVYGVVYEPSTEDNLVLDSHGDYMIAEQIEKAAHSFMLKAQNIDTQHNFVEGAGNVVESYIAPADFEVDGETITKGSWVLVTKAEPDVWEAIKKGEYTGYSLAGTATVIEKGGEKVNKQEQPEVLAKSDDEVKGFFNLMKAFFTGKADVQKGAVMDRFNEESKRESLWTAWYAFQSIVMRYNWGTDKYEFEEDATKVQEAITDLVTILQGILASDNIMKSIGQPPEEIAKAGKSISSANLKQIQSAYDALGSLIEANTKETEEDTVTKEQAEQLTKSIEALTDMVQKQNERLDSIEKDAGKAEEVEKKAEEAGEKAAEVEKAQEEAVSTISKQLETLTDLVQKQNERLEAVEKARGVQKAADAEEQEEKVQKSEFGNLFAGIRK